METTQPAREWIHRRTWSDGRMDDSAVHEERPGQPCFAGLSEAISRRRDQGVKVVHLVRSGDGEWQDVSRG